MTMDTNNRVFQLERQMHHLRLVMLVVVTSVSIAVLSAFRLQASRYEKFTEINVERINIIEADGRVRMVLSNRERSPAPMYKGKPFAYQGGTRAGVIFYDDEGTE